MYEERVNKFSVKDLIIQILLIAFFVFILLWLFPTKGDLANLNTGGENNSEESTVLYDRIFYENILIMKDAAKSYYTNDRLPVNVGDKVSMTLKEMIEKNLVLDITDKNGDLCDVDESYVEVTRSEESEYILKVNLKCGSEENYILVYMGCYDYCHTDMCEKNKEDVYAPVLKPVVKPNKNIINVTITQICPECCKPEPEKPDPDPTPDPDPKPDPDPDPEPDKEYICEYAKYEGATFGPWKEWSEWTTEAKSTNQLQQVKSKVVRTTVTKKILTGYNMVTYYDKNKPLYKTVQVESGTKTEKVCATYGTTTVGNGSYTYGDWKDNGTTKYYVAPKSTDTTAYVLVSTGVDNCKTCDYRTYYIYRKLTRSKTENTNTIKQCTSYKTISTPLYKTVQVLTGYGTSERKEPVYKQVDTVDDVKYYSVRRRNVIAGKKLTEWDVCEDSKYLGQGYEATGNKKEK